MSAIQITWWVGLPYLALGIFVVGHIWRWRYDQFGWTSRSTQLQEGRLLKWGSPVFHYGTFAAIGGHVLGVLIPAAWMRAVGIPENVYRWFSAGAGTLAAVLVIIGVVILAGRRLIIPRVRATTAPVDYVVLILLLIIILTGIAPTVFVNLLGHGYDYRTTVAPWFRGLFSGSPNVSLMASAPVIYQVHVTAAWLIWAVWPFSRLVHAWSYPLWYLWRPYVVYRRRRAVPPHRARYRWAQVAADRRPLLTPKRQPARPGRALSVAARRRRPGPRRGRRYSLTAAPGSGAALLRRVRWVHARRARPSAG